MFDIKMIFSPPHGKRAFLRKMNKRGKLVDVGCGNNSPYYVKFNFPEIKYIGVDVGDHNQTKENLADEYILVNPDEFHIAITKIGNDDICGIDTIISSHNLEHCNKREETLDAMMKILKKGGRMYLSFLLKEVLISHHVKEF